MWVTIHDCPIPYTEAQSPNMCFWTHNRYDLLSVTMHDCLLLFIICAESLSAYTQPYSPTTFKLQHIYTIHTHMECYNEWTDISKWIHSRMASVPFCLWTYYQTIIVDQSTLVSLMVVQIWIFLKLHFFKILIGFIRWRHVLSYPCTKFVYPIPVDTRRNGGVVVTSRRRFDVIVALLLRCVLIGIKQKFTIFFFFFFMFIMEIFK